MSSSTVRQKHLQQTIEKYQLASLFCSFSQKATITGLVMTILQCGQDHYSELRSLNFHPLVADPRLCHLTGMFIGGYVFTQLHQMMHTKIKIHQIDFEMKKYAFGDVPEKKPTRRQRCIAFSNKINKSISFLWNYIGGGWRLINRAHNTAIFECLNDEKRFDHVAIAKKYHIKLTPIIHLDPLGEGICYGISLYFAKQYLMGKTKEMLAKELSRGAPKEAVILQGQCDMVHSALLHQPGLTHYDLLPFASRKRRKIHQQAISIADAIMIEIAQLSIGKIFKIFNCDTCDTPLGLQITKSGIYEIRFSLLEPSVHSVILIKEGSMNFLFDSNEGKLFKQKHPSHALQFLSNWYSIDKTQGFIITELLLNPSLTQSTDINKHKE